MIPGWARFGKLIAMLDLLDKNRPLFNAFLRINHPWTAEMVGKAGFDMITFDMQHGMIEYSDVIKMIGSLPANTLPLARLPQNDAGLTMKLLDAGVHGIICPQVKTAEEVKIFVNSCYYPPDGERSFGPMRSGTLNPNYVQDAKNIVIPFALIETKEAIANLESIASAKGLKGLYVGPYDLSLSLGLTQMADFKDPELLGILKRIVAIANEHELILAIQVYDLQFVPMLYKLGFRVFGVFDDQILFNESLKKRKAKFKNIKDQIT